MKTFIQEIQEILTPNNTVSLVQDNLLYSLQPFLPFAQLVEMANDMDEAGQKKLLDFCLHENTVIFNGIVHVKTKGLNFKGRLQEILTVYHDHLKEVVGDKKALIDLYDSVPVEDLINLIEDHVIFVMKRFATKQGRGLAAIRYLPNYDVHSEKRIFQFPGVMLVLPIDNNLVIAEPEVISENNQYEHPFVFRDVNIFGQRICMGSFAHSHDKMQFSKLRFANTINNLLKQAVQILVSGYNRGVTPANGHLDSSIYQKYLKK